MLAFGIFFLVSAHGLHTISAAVAKHPREELPIQYPEPIEDDVPEACKHLTYCTIKPKNYPEKKFNDMLKGYKAIPQPSMVVELHNRQGDPDDEDNCESEVTFEPLYKVREKEYKPWRTVVQAPEQDFVQRVRLETCINTGAPCFNVFTPLPEYVTFCKQKVNTWKVLVSKGNNQTEMIMAELPVCCSCHYRPIDFVTRFGKPKE
ncbi:unnamed protein product, partial [Brenthis ino]